MINILSSAYTTVWQYLKLMDGVATKRHIMYTFWNHLPRTKWVVFGSTVAQVFLFFYQSIHNCSK